MTQAIKKTQPARELTYAGAIREALGQAMRISSDVVVLGQLVDYPSGVFGTTTGLAEEFGANRVQDFPVAEATMSSVALGAAVAGLRPVIIHQRVDFMLYSIDSIVNWMSLWFFKSNGKSTAPVTIRAIIGKGWGQGPQHSKSLHSWFAHVPGLRVAMPSTAYDAKGLLLESILGENPTLILESRSLFSMSAAVPDRPYRVRFGQAAIPRAGTDVTLVALGYLVPIALRAAAALQSEGISVEVVDPRSISPLDRDTLCESVKKTGRLVAADPGWRMAGFAAEVIATVTEALGPKLKSAPIRVTFPDSHAPMTQKLEALFYPDEELLKREIRRCLK